VLVQIQTTQTTLSIGLGRKDLAVALYLDAENTPWHALGRPELTHSEPISFANPTGQNDYHFAPTAAITVQAARATAQAFLHQPTTRPTNVTWAPEGNPELGERRR